MSRALFRNRFARWPDERRAGVLFAKAGYLTHEGRKDILKLAVAMHHREWLSGVWDRSKTFALPVHFEPLFVPVDGS